MLVDARTVGDREWGEADVCVAGGGVAGLATALELAAAGVGVALVEHGERLTAHHHLGTTRMADDPRRGVVDPDGRAHGIPNLYVTGGSVFPTAGYAAQAA